MFQPKGAPCGWSAERCAFRQPASKLVEAAACAGGCRSYFSNKVCLLEVKRWFLGLGLGLSRRFVLKPSLSVAHSARLRSCSFASAKAAFLASGKPVVQLVLALGWEAARPAAKAEGTGFYSR